MRARAALGVGGRTILLLGIVSMLTDISSEMILNLLPIFLHGTLGVSVAGVGVIEGVGESAAASTRLIAGRWSDRLPRRLPLVIGGYGLSAATKPLFALATGPIAAGWLRFGDRVGKGVRTPARDALIADVADAGRRGTALGLHRAIDTLGAVIGVLTAALIVFLSGDGDGLSRGGFQRVALIATVPAVLAVLLLTRVRERPSRRKKSGSSSWAPSLPGTSEERTYLLVLFLFALGNSSDAFLILRMSDIGLSVVGVLVTLALMNVVYATVSVPAGHWSDRVGRRKLLLLGYVAYAVIYAGFAVVGSVPAALVLVALYGAYYGATEGISRAFASDLAPPSGRGNMFGWFHAVTALGVLPANVVAGALWTAAGPGAAFLFGSACSLAAAALLFRMGRSTEVPAR